MEESTITQQLSNKYLRYKPYSAATSFWRPSNIHGELGTATELPEMAADGSIVAYFFCWARIFNIEVVTVIALIPYKEMALKCDVNFHSKKAESIM